jgi:hypothetical protein
VAETDYLTSETFASDCAQVVSALDRARAARNFEDSRIREAVARCAANARNGSCPPEKLIVALKTLVRDVALPNVRDWYQTVLTDRIIVWAIEAYYGIEPR